MNLTPVAMNVNAVANAPFMVRKNYCCMSYKFPRLALANQPGARAKLDWALSF